MDLNMALIRCQQTWFSVMGHLNTQTQPRINANERESEKDVLE